MGEISIINKTGDTKLLWDPAVKPEVEAAKRMFDDLRKKGYLGFAVAKKGDKGEQIREFDPAAARIIMSMPMVGG